MSGASDTRIVEMRFDNKNFESNVKQSMSTLDKLKKKLKLDGASKGLEEVEKKSKKIEFKDLNRSIDNVGKKFSALESIAAGAFMRIGMKAADAGIKIVKSFSVDQIASGWNRLASKTTAIQVIMSSLKDDASKFTDELSKMEYVEKWMEKISWFSDETSFDLPALTDGIGKLTSKAVGLEDAVTAVEGMSLWAASAGQNAQTAARMYDQLSQAVGRGYMATQDWMSVESAQMDTAEFKELAISIAEDMGIIKEGEVTIADFRNSLSKKWFTTDVQIEAYKRYGEAVDYVIQKQEELADAGIDKTASEILKMLEESGDEIADTLAFKALKRGQEAKTFQEAIEATNTAVATGWMNIFETITGNYLQQRELWTDLSNDLYHIFVDPLNEMTDVLSIWSEGFKINKVDPLADAYKEGKLDNIYNDYKVISKAAAEAALLTAEADGAAYREIRTLEDGTQQLVTFFKDSSGQYRYYVNEIFDEDKHFLSGRKVLLEGLKNIMDAFFLGWEEDIDGVKIEHLSVLDAVKQAFMEIFFPDLTGEDKNQTLAERLFELTKKFREFTEKLKPLGDKLKNVFKGFFTVINIVRKLIVSIIKPFKTLFSSIFGEVPDGVLGFSNSISEWIQQFDKFLEENKIFEKVSQGVKNGIEAISKALNWLSQKLTGLSLKELIPKAKEKLENFFKDFSLDKIKNFFKTTDAKDASPLQKFVNFVKKIIGGLYSFLQAIYKPLKKIVESVVNWISNLSLKFTKKATSTASTIEGKTSIFSGIETSLTNTANFLEGIYPRLEEAGGKIWDFLSTVLGKIADYIKTHDLLETVGAIIQIAIGLAIIWNIFRAMQMAKSIAYIGEGIGDVLYGVYKNMNAKFIQKIATSLLIVAGAFALLGSINFKTSIWTIIGIFVGFLAFCTAILAITKEFSKDKVRLAQFKLMTMAITKFILALASSLLILSVAFALMSKVNFTYGSLLFVSEIFAGFILLASALAFVSAKFINNAQTYSSLTGMAKFIQALAVSLIILSAAFALMSMVKFDADKLEAISKIFMSFMLIGSGLAFISAKFINNANSYSALSGMAKFIYSLATAVIILSAAFALMSMVKFDEGELEAINSVFLGFIVISSGLAYVSGKFINNENAYSALLGMAEFLKSLVTSLIILSAAFALMSLVKFDEGELGTISGIFVSFIMLASLLALISAKFANNANAYSALKGMSAFIMALAASLVILTAAFAVFAHTDFTKNESMKDIASVFMTFIVVSMGMVALLLGINRSFGNGYNITKVFYGITLFVNAMAVALVILSAAFAIMASIPFNNNMWSIAAIFGVFIAVTSGIAILAVKVFRNENFVPASWKIGLMAVFVNALAASLLIVSEAFSMMNSLKLEPSKMWNIAAVFGAFISISALIALLASKMITDWKSIAGVAAVAVFMIAAAGALNLAALAIAQIANGVDPEKLEGVSKILIILGVIVSVLGVIGVMAGAIGPWGAVALALIAVVIIAFGAACLIASKGVAALFEALATHGKKAAKNLEIVAKSFGNAIDEVSSHFGKILLIELAILLLGVAIGVLAGAMLGLAVPVAVIVLSITLLISSIKNLLEVFTNFIDVVTREGKEFSSNVLDVVNSVLDAIIETGPKLRDAVYTIITALVDALASGIVNNVNKITLAVFAIIVSIAKGISDNAFIIAYSIAKIVVLTILGIIAALTELADPAIQTLVAFIQALAEAIENNLDPIIEAGEALGEALLKGVWKAISDSPIANILVRLLVPGVGNALADAPLLAKWYDWVSNGYSLDEKPKSQGKQGSSATGGFTTDDARAEKASSKKRSTKKETSTTKNSWFSDASDAASEFKSTMSGIWSDYVGEGSFLSFFTGEGSENGLFNFEGMLGDAKTTVSGFASDVTGYFSGWGNIFSGFGLGGGKEKSELDLAYERGELDSLNNKYKTITKSAAEAAVESKKTGDILYQEIITLDDGSQRLATHIRDLNNGQTHVEYTDIYDDQQESGLQGLMESLLGSDNTLEITPIIDGTNPDEWLTNLLGGEHVMSVTTQQTASAANDVNSATGQAVTQQTYSSNDTYYNTFNITSTNPKTAADEIMKTLTNSVNRKYATFDRVQ